MAIASGDILLKLSIKTGSAGNSGAQSDAGQSLGKYISTTQVSTSLNALFDKMTGAENANANVDYRCVFIHNSHASLTAESVVIYLSSVTSGGADIAIAVDTTAASAIGGSSAQAVSIATDTDVPSGASFSAPTTYGGGIAVGDIAAGQCRAIWIRRTGTNSSPKDTDGVTLAVALDTAE